MSSLNFKNAKTSLASEVEALRIPAVFASYQAGEKLLRRRRSPEQTLQALQDKIDGYSETVGKPRSAASNNRAAGKLADAEFEAAEKLLVEQLDGLILKFKTSQPAFYNAYRSARETVNNAAGHNGKNGGKSSTGHDTPPPPQ